MNARTCALALFLFLTIAALDLAISAAWELAVFRAAADRRTLALIAALEELAAHEKAPASVDAGACLEPTGEGG